MTTILPTITSMSKKTITNQTNHSINSLPHTPKIIYDKSVSPFDENKNHLTLSANPGVSAVLSISDSKTNLDDVFEDIVKSLFVNDFDQNKNTSNDNNGNNDQDNNNKNDNNDNSNNN